MQDEVERQLASLGKTICALVMTMTSVSWAGVDSDICLLVTILITV